MSCNQNSCEGGLSCCVNIDYYPGFYCKVASQCHQQPIWQVIVIPSLLAFLTLALGLIICCKLRGKKANKRDARTYAYQQVRVKPQPFSIQNRLRTFTTVPQSLSPDNVKFMSKMQTQATPNNRNTRTDVSTPI